MKKILILSLAMASTLLAVACSQTKNEPPQITSPDTVEATGGVFFAYRAAYVDPDNFGDTVSFVGYPAWLTVEADSIFGTPPDGLADTAFTIVIYDGLTADTARVTIRMIPSMVVYGDTRSGHDIHRRIVDSLMTVKPSVVFHTGDLVSDGLLADDWAVFNDITDSMRAQAEFFPALGNHDRQSPLYFDNFDLPGNEEWYSVDRNYVHFICLNSCVETDTASVQYHWLEHDLASVPDSVRFIVAVFHHPPYSTSRHTEDEKGLRQTWVPLFEKYDVDAVFNGHDHCYERSYCGGIYYIVAGGGGAPLYDQARQHPCSQLFLKQYHFCKVSVVNDRMIVKVYGLDKNLIDQFEIDKTPAGL